MAHAICLVTVTRLDRRQPDDPPGEIPLMVAWPRELGSAYLGRMYQHAKAYGLDYDIGIQLLGDGAGTGTSASRVFFRALVGAGSTLLQSPPHFRNKKCWCFAPEHLKHRDREPPPRVPQAQEQPIALTTEQQEAVAAINAAIDRHETFVLHGLAGSGKTTVAAHIARSRPGAFLCAPTGKAASVLRDKTGSRQRPCMQPFTNT